MITRTAVRPLFLVLLALLFAACAPPAQARSKGGWRPLARPTRDAATTFLLDPGSARHESLMNGGFIDAATGGSPWGRGGSVAIVPGRFGLGVQSRTPNFGYIWMPGTGLLSPRAFTIEFWLRSAVPFASAVGTPVSLEGIDFTFDNRGHLFANYEDDQALSPIRGGLFVNVSALPGGRWTEFALTYAAGRLTGYINGHVVATRNDVPAPAVWSDDNRDSGLTIGGAAGRGAGEFAVSDVRISRVARVPGRRSKVASTLTVTDSPAHASIHQTLLGGLHTLTTPATVHMARGVLHVIRTDKLINSTPIKLGLPDRGHPSRGISGLYSYNWAVVDRTLRYLKRLRVRPYLSVDATPSILGGTDLPLLGTLLNTVRSYVAPFPAQVPDNLVDWQAIVEDLAYRILKQDRIRVAYWGVWNEPDGAEFWAGTLNQYLALYGASVTAIRHVDPHAMVGGAETASWDPGWTSGLMGYVARNHLPLNFVSWHYYSGDLEDIAEARSAVAALAGQLHIARPALIIGEWAWQAANLPGIGQPPFRNENYFLNDWSAAFAGASLIEMQREGVVASVYTNPVASARATGFPASGLMSGRHAWANFNVFRLWHLLPAHELRTRLDADPGIFAVAARGRRTLDALLASLHYSRTGRFVLTIRFPRRLAGHRATIWVVDRHHGDAFDDSHHAALRPRHVRLSRQATVNLALAARSVALVQVTLG